MFPSATLFPLMLATLSRGAAIDRRRLYTRDTPAGNVIAQMFEWNWDTIAAECTNVLGPAGYAFVQTSPPQEHAPGPEWFTDFQVVSFNLVSKRGNRDQFTAMIDTCHKAGVQVIADTVTNHMTAGAGTGSAGTVYTKFDYPGVYQLGDFHQCGLAPNNNIVDFTNRTEVQTCELVGLADLATETEPVQTKIAAYINDLMSLGVDGLRIDAAKHMPAADIASYISRLTTKPSYITLETIFGEGEPVQPEEYVQIGDAQEFRYTSTVQAAFSGTRAGGIADLLNIDKLGFVDGTNANVFVANHDTERNGASLNFNSPSNTYISATIFSLAFPYGKPTVLSSYQFTDINAGSPNAGAGACSGTGGADGWICQHRFLAFTGMVGFRNNAGTSGVSNVVYPAEDQVAFERTGTGFVAINNADTAWNGTFTTTLPDGSYCDVVGGAVTSGTCGAAAFTVSGGSFSATVAPRAAIAIHTGAKGAAAGSPAPSTRALEARSDAVLYLPSGFSLFGSVLFGLAYTLAV